MKRALFIPLLMALSIQTNAGTGQGTVSKVEHGPLYGTKVFVTLVGSISGQPACQSPSNATFVFDTAAPGGKDILASVLLSKANQQISSYSGFNQCALWNGVEDLRWFRME